MKYLFLIVFVLIPQLAFGAPTLLSSFGSDGDLTSGDWDGGYGATRICTAASGTVSPTTTGTACLATWITDTYSGDQGGQVTITTLNDGSDLSSSASILLRANPSTDRTWYRCIGLTGAGAGKGGIIQRVVAGAATDLGFVNGSGFVASDALRCTITGTSLVTIRMFKNDVEILNAVDNDPLTGDRIGFACYTLDNLSDCAVDDFSTNPFVAPTTVVKRRPIVME